MMSVRKDIEEISNDKVKELAERLYELVVEKAPESSGDLSESVRVYKQEDMFILKVGENYAMAVHEGRSPGTPPPIEALKGWAKREIGTEEAAWPIQRNIAKEGTEGQPFVRQAIDQLKQEA